MTWLFRINLVFFSLLVVEPFLAGAVAQKPAFEVATIRPSRESVKFEHDGKTEFSGDTLRMQDVTVNTCIKLAYHVQDRQIAGPGWLTSDHFDITAKADGAVDEDTMKQRCFNLCSPTGLVSASIASIER